MAELQQNAIIHDRYRLLKHLGSGSFGDVWLAEDTIIQEEIAIKFYVALDEKGQEEFIKEYKTSLKLNHSNLLTPKHYSVWERRPYLTLEYCPNGSADKLLGEADEKTIWRFIRDVASGLNYLHKNNVIHQDIKPDNVLINSQGDFVITDFGISYKIRTTMRKQSKRTENSGTVAYMGPERFKSDPQLITASDVWSLGASIYELATGDLPFNGLGGGMMLSGAELPNLPSKFSEDLNRVMRLCLSKEPWDRPLSETLVKIAIAKLKGDSINTYLPKTENKRTTNTNTQPQNTDNNSVKNNNQTTTRFANNQKTTPYSNSRNANYRSQQTSARVEKAANIGNYDNNNNKTKKTLGFVAAFVVLALVIGLIVKLSGGNGGTESATEQITETQNNTVAEKYETFTVNGVSFTMVFVEGGTFTMGATSEQGSDADDDEKPTHRVTLSDYYIGETEVTQALWKAVMGNNPSYFEGDNLPVEKVSYEDVKTFITKLNGKTGKKFRLPTEAEWEYAARGGNKSKGYKYSGSNNIDDVAWYDDNSNLRTHPVKTKQPNELGIYDMNGNVWEWCSDWYGGYSSNAQTNPQGPSSGSYRVIRGGSWFGSARYCRASYRYHDNLSDLGNTLGFRLALAL